MEITPLLNWEHHDVKREKHTFYNDPDAESTTDMYKTRFFTERVDPFIKAIFKRKEISTVINLGEYYNFSHAENLARELTRFVAVDNDYLESDPPICYIFYTMYDILNDFCGILSPYAKINFNTFFQSTNRIKRCRKFPLFYKIINEEAEKLGLIIEFEKRDRGDFLKEQVTFKVVDALITEQKNIVEKQQSNCNGKEEEVDIKVDNVNFDNLEAKIVKDILEKKVEKKVKKLSFEEIKKMEEENSIVSNLDWMWDEYHQDYWGLQFIITPIEGDEYYDYEEREEETIDNQDSLQERTQKRLKTS